MSFYLVIKDIKSAFLYHEYLHGPRPLIAVISLLKMLTGLEVWKLYIGKFIVRNFTLVTITKFHSHGILIEYQLNEYAPFPVVALLYGAYYVAKHYREMSNSPEKLTVVTSLYTFMLLGLLDPIAWYYLPLHYFAAMTIPLFFKRPKSRLLVLSINIAYLVIAWLLGLHYHTRILEATIT